jgi:hypothetical protein
MAADLSTRQSIRFELGDQFQDRQSLGPDDPAFATRSLPMRYSNDIRSMTAMGLGRVETLCRKAYSAALAKRASAFEGLITP